jgi:hypothetical protein
MCPTLSSAGETAHRPPLAQFSPPCVRVRPGVVSMPELPGEPSGVSGGHDLLRKWIGTAKYVSAYPLGSLNRYRTDVL